MTVAVFKPEIEGPPGGCVKRFPPDPGANVTVTSSEGVVEGTVTLTYVVDVPPAVDVL